jgi:G3E family GTPase
VHGVQHLFHPPAALPQWPDDQPPGTQIVVILRDLDPEVLRHTLRAFLADTSQATL